MVMPSTGREQVQGKRLRCVRCEVPVGHPSGESRRQLDNKGVQGSIRFGIKKVVILVRRASMERLRPKPD